MTEQGDTGYYYADMPEAIAPGVYLVVALRQLGGSPDDGDTVVGYGNVTHGPVDSSTGVSPVEIIRPEIPQMELAVLQRKPGMRISQGQVATVEWTLRNGEGRPLDVSGYVIGSFGSSIPASMSSSSAAPEGRIEARLREPFTSGDDALTSIDGSATDPTDGKVQFTLPAAATATPQVLLMDIGVFDGDERLIAVNHGYLIVERSLFGTSYYRIGVPTVDEVKIRLRDSGTNDNFLLARIEYSLGEVAEAMIRAVSMWNTIGGPNVSTMTTATFDDPDLLMDGIVGYLFEIVGANYRRNHLQYQAAGVAVDDKANYGEYDKLAQSYLEKYRYRVATTVRRAARSAWARTIPSPYAIRRGSW
jgi:hypothetical protein